MNRPTKREILTIPNILGYIRILIVPLFILRYITAQTDAEYMTATILIVFSSFTDLIDGKIARRFNMVTELGKFLDPVADKLTQGALLICLSYRFELLRPALVLFLCKELFMAVMGVIMLKFRQTKLDGAMWYGKICTAMLFMVSIILLLIPSLPYSLKFWLVNLLIIDIIFTFIMYCHEFYCMWKGKVREKKEPKKSKSGIYIPFIIVFIVAYLVIGAITPFAKQKEVSQATKDAFNAEEYFEAQDSVDRASLVETNDQAWTERIRLLNQAQDTIILSTFDMRNGESTKDLAAVILNKANEGVKVRIMVDGFNGTMRMYGDPFFYALSSHPNIEIKLYNILNPLTPWTSQGRMHDKYIIVDNKAYILGGRNTFDYFIGSYYSDSKSFDREVLVFNTAWQNESDKSSSLYDVEEYFDGIWDGEYCSLFKDKESLSKKDSVEEQISMLEERYNELKKDNPELFTEHDYVSSTYKTEGVHLISGDTGIYGKEPAVFYKLSEIMKLAKNRVIIHTPYAVCSEYMTNTLAEVAAEVPDTHIMLNSIENGDNVFASSDYMYNKSDLINTGIDIYEYDGGYSYHGKTILIDDNISIIGSYNFDMRSTYIDTEVMVVVNSKEFTSELADRLEEFEENSRYVTGENEYKVPDGLTVETLPESTRIMYKVLGFVTKPFRFLL